MNPTESLSFRWAWRPYQQRVLNAVEHHLDDDRLHIVAAPGSGKTILGIEAFRRLGRPALVLSPTRTIRNQWLERLREFLPSDAPWPPSWAGSDLDCPAFFTSITYQALHVSFPDKDRQQAEEAEIEEPKALSQDEIGHLLCLFKKAGIGTLILDEAHHLHSAWWKSLDKLVRSLPGLTVVSLTATPPYEVTGAKWRKYSDLCGPIDEEISVPELVKEHNLCPHQDYVWVVEAPSVTQRLQAYDASVDDFCARLYDDPVFRRAIAAHPLLGNEVDPVLILADPELAVALLVFLRAAGQPFPKHLSALLDIKKGELPALDRRWWQVLVKAYLYDRRWLEAFEQGGHRKEVAGSLRAADLLWRRELRLVESRPLKTQLALSPEKIDGCVQICRLEKAARGENLRQVFLTDYIRDESLSVDGGTDLGACPLFCALIHDAAEGAQPFYGLLTGRLTIVHQGLVESLQGLDAGDGPTFTPLNALPGFARVSDTGRSLTPFFTRLLQKGRLRVLVGTRSLLGEGWDAPVINSLVLASFVGSYMLTNQMRGRAIRVDPGSPDKVASIWHLTSIEPSTTSGYSDVEELKRRFTTFVGVRQSEPVIENGIERLDLPWHYRPGTSLSRVDPQRSNEEMALRLKEAEGLGRHWREAIETGGAGQGHADAAKPQTPADAFISPAADPPPAGARGTFSLFCGDIRIAAGNAPCTPGRCRGFYARPGSGSLGRIHPGLAKTCQIDHRSLQTPSGRRVGPSDCSSPLRGSSGVRTPTFGARGAEGSGRAPIGRQCNRSPCRCRFLRAGPFCRQPGGDPRSGRKPTLPLDPKQTTLEVVAVRLSCRAPGARIGQEAGCDFLPGLEKTGRPRSAGLQPFERRTQVFAQGPGAGFFHRHGTAGGKIGQVAVGSFGKWPGTGLTYGHLRPNDGGPAVAKGPVKTLSFVTIQE